MDELVLVEHRAQSYPSGLKPAEELNIAGLSTATITELAEAGYLPHYRINGGEPVFRISEVKAWVNENLLQRCEGMSLPDRIRVVVPAPLAEGKKPTSICHIPNLRILNIIEPGIYFLCQGLKVMYVGQSTQPQARIASHTDKEFDSAYLLPVPQSDLDEMEAAFIHHLKPVYNGRYKTGTLVSPPLIRTVEELYG